MKNYNSDENNNQNFLHQVSLSEVEDVVEDERDRKILTDYNI